MCKSIMRLFLLVGIAVLICLSLSCDQEKITKTKADPEIDPFTYPLEVGKIWEYSGAFYRVNIKPDSMTRDFTDTSIINTEIEIVSIDTLMQSIPAYRFEETTDYDGIPYSGYCYMDNVGGNFVMYSSSHTGQHMLPFKATSGVNYRFMNHEFGSVAELLTFFKYGLSSNKIDQVYKPKEDLYDHVSLAYPLQIDRQWLVSKSFVSVSITKQVTGTKSVTTPAGTFDCFVIEQDYFSEADPIDNEITYIDYVAEEGLIARLIIVRDIQFIDLESDIVGTFDAITKYELVDYE